MFFLFSLLPVSALAGKKKSLDLLNEWWTDSTILDPFKLDVFDFADFRALNDDQMSCVLTVCYLASQHRGKGHVSFVFWFFSSHFTRRRVATDLVKRVTDLHNWCAELRFVDLLT